MTGTGVPPNSHRIPSENKIHLLLINTRAPSIFIYDKQQESCTEKAREPEHSVALFSLCSVHETSLTVRTTGEFIVTECQVNPIIVCAL